MEYPSQSYFPGARIRLSIRFDEFGATKDLRKAAPERIQTRLKGVKDVRNSFQLVPEIDTTTGTKRIVIRPADSTQTGGPQDSSTSSDDLTHVIEGIIPLRMEVGLNGIRTADTLKVDLRFLDLPIDPRTVRACGVEAYLGTFSEDQFAANMRNQTDALQVIPESWIDERGRTRSNLRFQGFVDEWEVEFDEGREPIVRLQCRDNTQLLIDTDAPSSLVLAMDQPIDKCIATYLSNFPIFLGLAVEYRGGDAPVLKGLLSKTAYSEKTGGPTPSKGGTGGKLSVWDYLTDIVGAIGHTVRLEGTTIIVEKPHTMLNSKAAPREDDPYAGRELTSGFYPVRTLIYGRNLMSLKFGRKFGKAAPRNIEVRCYSCKRKKTLVARFPSVKDALVHALPGDGNADVGYQVIFVNGIEDERTLGVIAQSYYEARNRSELNVAMRTRNLASFGGGNLDPDILDMRAGDTIEVKINRNRDDHENTVSVIEEALLVQEQAREFLKTVGYSDRFASAYGKAYSNGGFQTKYKVRSATFLWEMDQGITIDICAVNFIEARAEKEAA
jgi:hypothetical protein